MSVVGKHILVTGGTSGIGLATACLLSKAGAHLTVVTRNRERGQAALAQLREIGPDAQHDIVGMDFASLESVSNATREYLMAARPVDVLVNNAGIINSRRKLTIDGFEETFAVNHLAPFLFTGLMLSGINGSGSRIINVASGAHDFVRGINFDDLNSEQRYRIFKAYGQSKLANMLFTIELARRLQTKGITCNSVHPGAVGTNLGSQNQGMMARFLPLLLKPFFKTPQEGAATAVYLCQAPELATVTGKYFFDSKLAQPKPWAEDFSAAKQLWEVSEKMTGFSYNI
ncbi:MAG: SDR family oxidoreductase [Halieaceae bacterium]|nr:SDR family oxidoreductase [Halieaceae bacterium]